MEKEQYRTQISKNHRLIKIAQRYGNALYDEYGSPSEYISPNYFMEKVIAYMRMALNESVAQRQNAAIYRSRVKSKQKKIGIHDVIAEVFYDNKYFRSTEKFFSPKLLKPKIKELIDKKQKIEMLLPILSRKPLSPIKNKGTLPDVSEIETLMRCATIGRIINNLSPLGGRVMVLADGYKYNRACGTANEHVFKYQESLRFWIDRLGIGDVVNLVDYEQWIQQGRDKDFYHIRENLLKQLKEEIEQEFNPLFNPKNLVSALTNIKNKNDIGMQLNYTFWSIITSVNYKNLYSDCNNNNCYFDDNTQKIYLSYISSLHLPLDEVMTSHLALCLPLPVSSLFDLFYNLRQQAWQAAICYVAISLVDRQLKTLKYCSPDGIKLTIHGKQSEIHFISSSLQNIAITAQHCVGGLSYSKERFKVNFKYRIEREMQGEFPVFMKPIEDSVENRKVYGSLVDMSLRKQPIFYIDKSERNLL